jgi:hypothetical protein
MTISLVGGAFSAPLTGYALERAAVKEKRLGYATTFVTVRTACVRRRA